MSIEQALEELKKYARDFANVGDAKQAIQNNKEDFLHKWTKVMQFYKYIIENVKSMSDEWFMAVDILSDVSVDNPSLEEWVQQIIEPKNEKIQTQSKNNASTNTETISGPIESLISEVNNMQSWDPDYIGNIEWQLQEYQKMLISNQSSFDSNVYQSLMNDINAALNKINRFNSMLNSETMEGIKKM